MNKRSWSVFLIIGLLILLCGCSNTNEADVTDETVFSPPEEDGTLAGIWSTEIDTLSINSYFYGDGKYVSFIQDPEEETWCVLAYWSENGDNIEIKDQSVYEYDSAEGKWNEADQTIGLSTGTKMNDDEIEASCIIPDGNTQTVTLSRSEKDMQIPSDVDINLIINGFLIH